MTPILTWIMYPPIAPVVRKLSPTVIISAYGAVSAYFSWLVAREDYSLLLVGKGYRDGGTLYGSMSPVRAHPILVSLCPVKLIKLEISSHNMHSLWQGLRVSLFNANSYSFIYIQLLITIHLKTLNKFLFKIKPYFLLNSRGHGSKRYLSSNVLVRFTFLPNR